MAIIWAQRLKRVFGIDIETCRACGGAVRIIARIEDPVVMPKALRGAGPREDSILRSVNGASMHHSSHPPREERHVDGDPTVAAVPGAAPGGLVR